MDFWRTPSLSPSAADRIIYNWTSKRVCCEYINLLLYSHDGKLLPVCDPEVLSCETRSIRTKDGVCRHSPVQLRTHLSGFLFSNVDIADGARHYAVCCEGNRTLIVFMTGWYQEHNLPRMSCGCAIVLLSRSHRLLAFSSHSGKMSQAADHGSKNTVAYWTEWIGYFCFQQVTAKRLALSPRRCVAKIQLQSASPLCRRLWNSDRILLWLQSPAVPPTQARSGKQCQHYKSRQRLPQQRQHSAHVQDRLTLCVWGS